MRKFEGTTIIANGSYWDERMRAIGERYWERDGDLHMKQFLQNDLAQRSETDMMLDYSQASIQYEDRVCRVLAQVRTSTIGSLVMSSINPKVKVWVVPYDSSDRAANACGANTFGTVKVQGGDHVLISFSPEDWHPKGCTLDTADTVLFHELVHAYRYSWLGYHGVNNKVLKDYSTTEEFLATHMHNIYRSLRGELWFHRTHSIPKFTHLDGMRNYFDTDQEARYALNFYLDTDTVTKQVANWKGPDFNPFRDHRLLRERLSREWQNNLRDIRKTSSPMQLAPKLRTMVPPAR